MATDANEFHRRPLDWNHKTCLTQIGLHMEGPIRSRCKDNFRLGSHSGTIHVDVCLKTKGSVLAVNVKTPSGMVPFPSKRLRAILTSRRETS
jgi:hypothetical protein